jgi:hypothetical protein
MFDEIKDNRPDNRDTGSTGKWIAVGAFLVLAATNGFLFSRVNSLEAQIDNQNKSTLNEMAQVRDASVAAAESLRANIGLLSADLETKTGEANTAAKRAAAVAQQHADKLVHELTALQQTTAERIDSKIGEIEASAQENAAKVEGIQTYVGAVQEDVDQAKSLLDGTIGDVGRHGGELGVHSTRIATNAQELAELRALGERNYQPFTLAKKEDVKVDNVVLNLRKTDAKRNKFNLYLTVDDKQVEKKDRTINEPILFYVAGARQPFEIVVNEVTDDTVVGYLSAPKVLQTRR